MLGCAVRVCGIRLGMRLMATDGDYWRLCCGSYVTQNVTQQSRSFSPVQKPSFIPRSPGRRDEVSSHVPRAMAGWRSGGGMPPPGKLYAEPEDYGDDFSSAATNLNELRAGSIKYYNSDKVI